jgi:hypothetical protein
MPIGHHDEVDARNLMDVVGAVDRGVVRLDGARLADVEGLAGGDVARLVDEQDP